MKYDTVSSWSFFFRGTSALVVSALFAAAAVHMHSATYTAGAVYCGGMAMYAFMMSVAKSNEGK